MRSLAQERSTNRLSVKARWALRTMGEANNSQGGQGDTVRTANAATFDIMSGFRVSIPRSSKRQLRSHFTFTDGSLEAKQLMASTNGFGLGQLRKGNENEIGFDGLHSRQRKESAEPVVKGRPVGYNSVEGDSGKSVIQARFDQLVLDAIVQYCPVTMQSVRITDLYSMLRRLDANFTVDSHCDGMPLSVMCSQCSYLNGFGGRLHFMRVIRPTGRHHRAINDNVVSKGGQAADRFDSYGRDPLDAAGDAPRHLAEDSVKRAMLYRAQRQPPRQDQRNVPEDEDEDAEIEEQEGYSEGVRAAEMILSMAEQDRSLNIFEDELDRDARMYRKPSRPTSASQDSRYPTYSPSATDTASAGSLNARYKGPRASTPDWHSPTNTEATLRRMADEEAALQSFYGKYLVGPSPVDQFASVSHPDYIVEDHDGGIEGGNGPWYLRNRDRALANELKEAPVYLGIQTASASPSGTYKTTVDGDGYETLVHLPEVSKTEVTALQEQLNTAAAAAIAKSIEYKKSMAASKALPPPVPQTKDEQQLELAFSLMMGDEEAIPTATPLPASATTTATAVAEEEILADTFDVYDAAAQEEMQPTKRIRDDYFDNVHYRKEQRPEPGTVSATNPQLRPVTSDEHLYRTQINSTSPYKGGFDRYAAEMGMVDEDRYSEELEDEDAYGASLLEAEAEEVKGENEQQLPTKGRRSRTYDDGGLGSEQPEAEATMEHDATTRGTSGHEGHEQEASEEGQPSKDFDEDDDEIFADPEAALAEGRAMTVGLSKFEFKQAAAKDGVRQGPKKWAYPARDTFAPGAHVRELKQSRRKKRSPHYGGDRARHSL